MNYGDKIRQMTNEEMAKEFAKYIVLTNDAIPGKNLAENTFLDLLNKEVVE